jgi:hypothetical protein
LLRDVPRIVRQKQGDLWVCIGLEDPADTGMLYAWAEPVAVSLCRIPGLSVALHPDFSEERLEFRADGRCRIIPGEIAWVITRFALAPATVATIWEQTTWKR